MKALNIIIPDKLKIELQKEEIDETIVQDNEIIIKNIYSVISAGTELANYTAKDKGVYIKGSWNAYPYSPGYGAIGEVINVGKNFPDLKKGDKIFYIGKHRSIERYTGKFWVKPYKELNLIEATFLRMGMISITGLNIANFNINNTVVIIGLGVVGNITAQLFKIAGCNVIGIDIINKRLEIAEECGISHLCSLQGKETIKFILDLTKGKGADIVIDAVGEASICEYAINMVKKYGEFILLGTPRGDYNTNITPFLQKIHLDWVTVKGALEWCVPFYPVEGFKYSLYSNYITLCELVLNNKLKIKPLISHIIPATEIEKAYEGLLNKKDEYIGVILDWSKK